MYMYLAATLTQSTGGTTQSKEYPIMASLPRNTSSTSLNESPEYTTMRECHVVLVDLLKSAVGSLGDVLFAKGLIPSDVKESIHETTSRASATRVVIDHLTTQIKYCPSLYHEFVRVLEEQGLWTRAVVEKLTSCYDSQAAIPESSPMSVESSEPQSLKNREQENKPGQDSTEPKSIPPTVLKVLQSIHCQVGALIEDQTNEIQLGEDRRSSLAESGIDTIAGFFLEGGGGQGGHFTHLKVALPPLRLIIIYDKF